MGWWRRRQAFIHVLLPPRGQWNERRTPFARIEELVIAAADEVDGE